MAIAKGRSTEDASGFKRYIGVGNFQVLGVNPDKQTLNSWGIMTEKEPEYTDTATDKDGNEHRRARCTFYLKSVKFSDFITSVSFFLEERHNYSKDKEKIEVIDIYGNTTWLTADEAKTKRVPGDISKQFRASFVGEADLTNFIRNFLNIPSSKDYDESSRSYSLKTNAEDLEKAECTLDHIKDYFSGNFSELAEICKYQPENQVKMLCGIKSGNDGKLRQTISSRYTARAYDNNAPARFQNKVNAEKAAGYLQNTEYDFNALHEWVLKTATPEEVEAAIENSPFDGDDEDDLPFN